MGNYTVKNPDAFLSLEESIWLLYSKDKPLGLAAHEMALDRINQENKQPAGSNTPPESHTAHHRREITMTQATLPVNPLQTALEPIKR